MINKHPNIFNPSQTFHWHIIFKIQPFGGNGNMEENLWTTRVYSILSLTLITTLILLLPPPSTAWSNGGYSADPSNPDYGTHDWIAEHALDWLPADQKQYILENLDDYLCGTELPDNGGAPDGIGDF